MNYLNKPNQKMPAAQYVLIRIFDSGFYKSAVNQ